MTARLFFVPFAEICLLNIITCTYLLGLYLRKFHLAPEFASFVSDAGPQMRMSAYLLDYRPSILRLNRCSQKAPTSQKGQVEVDVQHCRQLGT